MQMSKVTYLLILFLLWVNFWDVKFLYIDDNSRLYVVLLYLLFGYYIFRSKKSQIVFSSPNKYLYYILGGMSLSMVSAYLFYNQSFTQSLITYRFQYYLIALPVIFKIKPNINEIIKSLNIFSILMFANYVLRNMSPSLYVLRDNFIIGFHQHLLLGYTLLSIPFYYYLQKLQIQFKMQYLLYIGLLITLIFLMGNRSLFFPVAIFMIYSFFKIKSRNKHIFIILILLVLIMVAYSTMDTLLSMYDESINDIYNEDYNRNRAILYFLFESSPNIFCTMFGNGMISIHHNVMNAILMGDGIHNSDVGFIGYWNYFGLIPVITMLYMYVKVLINKKYPYFLKLISLQTLLCGLTISFFAQPHHMLFFILFYYMFIYYNTTLSDNTL